jgi:hypothetical protein
MVGCKHMCLFCFSVMDNPHLDEVGVGVSPCAKKKLITQLQRPRHADICSCRPNVTWIIYIKMLANLGLSHQMIA